MRYLFLLLLIGVMSCQNNTQESANEEASTSEELSATEEASASEESSTYGEEINAEEPMELTEMVAQLEGQDSVYVTVKGEVTSTCKMKGCWMNVQLPDGDEMRVTFKDYGFFVPKEGMEGKTAVFEGYVTKSMVDEETRRHFAKDGGKSEEEIASIVGDEEQLSFVADGVVIYN